MTSALPLGRGEQRARSEEKGHQAAGQRFNRALLRRGRCLPSGCSVLAPSETGALSLGWVGARFCVGSFPATKGQPSPSTEQHCVSRVPAVALPAPAAPRTALGNSVRMFVRPSPKSFQPLSTPSQPRVNENTAGVGVWWGGAGASRPSVTAHWALGMGNCGFLAWRARTGA